MARPPRRTKPKDSGRRPRKKVSILNQEKVDYIDWKDVNLLRRFVSDRAKIRARRVTANNTQQQRAVAMAIKNAREMALLPYTSRVTTHRGPRSQGGDERGGPSDRVPSTEELTDLLDIEGAEGAEGVEVTVDALAGGEETE